MRYLTIVLATVFVLGFSGCSEKLKEGDACKRHSQCGEGMMCSAVDAKCQSKASERATRKAAAKGAAKGAKAKRLKAAAGAEAK